jgi:hypothetical protein
MRIIYTEYNFENFSEAALVMIINKYNNALFIRLSIGIEI